MTKKNSCRRRRHYNLCSFWKFFTFMFNCHNLFLRFRIWAQRLRKPFHNSSSLYNYCRSTVQPSTKMSFQNVRVNVDADVVEKRKYQKDEI